MPPAAAPHAPVGGEGGAWWGAGAPGWGVVGSGGGPGATGLIQTSHPGPQVVATAYGGDTAECG